MAKIILETALNRSGAIWKNGQKIQQNLEIVLNRSKPLRAISKTYFRNRSKPLRAIPKDGWDISLYHILSFWFYL